MKTNKRILMMLAVLAFIILDTIANAQTTTAKPSSTTKTPTTPPKPAKLTMGSALSKAWDINLRGVNLDPTTWNATFKEKALRVGIGVSYAGYLGYSLAYMLVFGVFLFGLVHLDWPMLAASCLTLYGWRRGHKMLLGVGLSLGYLLAFGYDVLANL
jgi:hypothetical protein